MLNFQQLKIIQYNTPLFRKAYQATSLHNQTHYTDNKTNYILLKNISTSEKLKSINKLSSLCQTIQHKQSGSMNSTYIEIQGVNFEEYLNKANPNLIITEEDLWCLIIDISQGLLELFEKYNQQHPHFKQYSIQIIKKMEKTTEKNFNYQLQKETNSNVFSEINQTRFKLIYHQSMIRLDQIVSNKNWVHFYLAPQQIVNLSKNKVVVGNKTNSKVFSFGIMLIRLMNQSNQNSQNIYSATQYSINQKALQKQMNFARSKYSKYIMKVIEGCLLIDPYERLTIKELVIFARDNLKRISKKKEAFLMKMVKEGWIKSVGYDLIVPNQHFTQKLNSSINIQKKVFRKKTQYGQKNKKQQKTLIVKEQSPVQQKSLHQSQIQFQRMTFGIQKELKEQKQKKNQIINEKNKVLQLKQQTEDPLLNQSFQYNQNMEEIQSPKFNQNFSNEKGQAHFFKGQTKKDKNNHSHQNSLIQEKIQNLVNNEKEQPHFSKSQTKNEKHQHYLIKQKLQSSLQKDNQSNLQNKYLDKKAKSIQKLTPKVLQVSINNYSSIHEKISVSAFSPIEKQQNKKEQSKTKNHKQHKYGLEVQQEKKYQKYQKAQKHQKHQSSKMVFSQRQSFKISAQQKQKQKTNSYKKQLLNRQQKSGNKIHSHYSTINPSSKQNLPYPIPIPTPNKQLKLLNLQFCVTSSLNKLKQSLETPGVWIDGDLYFGKIENGRRYGLGLQIFPNGQYYYGQFAQDLFHGEGFYFWNNFEYFLGKFIDGQKIEGYLRGSKLQYEGSFKNGKRHGNGKCWYVDGRFYEGQMVEGKRQGRGFFIEGTGDHYIGQFKNNKKNGKGQYYTPISIISGKWENDQIINEVQVKLKNGDSFKGKLVGVNLEKTGYGEYYFGSGGYFKGNFIKNCAQKGKLQYPNGQIYEGELKDMKRHGYGSYYYNNGTIYTGEWINGEIVNNSSEISEKDQDIDDK